MSSQEVMSSPGVQPLSPGEIEHRMPKGLAGLHEDAGYLLRWLLRGHPATSPLLPMAARRALLRLGGVRLGSAVWGLKRCWFESENVSIGDGCAINSGCWFEGDGRIVIGRNCLFGPEVMILTADHEIGSDRTVPRDPTPREVHIGDGCWLGARVMVMPGVTIGAGTVIGAGALVIKDCEPGAVYVGVPARRVR